MGASENIQESSTGAGLRILVADDDSLAATGIAALLARSGFKVVGPVADGHAAIELARAQRPDVCMLDIDMPGVDGLAAAQRIIAELDIPVIMLSGHSDPEHVDAATRAGVFGYMVKPSSQNQLRAAVSIALSMHESRRNDRSELVRMQRQVESRRLVEQAKWKLVSEQGLSEPAAHALLQNRSRDERRKLEDIAREVLGTQAVAVTPRRDASTKPKRAGATGSKSSNVS